MMNSPDPMTSSDAAKTHCLDTNLEFVMLNEILSAKSHQFVELLSKEKPDLKLLKRLAINMQLSTRSLKRDGVLVGSDPSGSTFRNGESTEPASLQSVVDLAVIALRHRLGELKVPLNLPDTKCDDRFISGNPYEISYCLFILALRIGQAVSRLQNRNMPDAGVYIQLTAEPDFFDIILKSPVQMSPAPDADEKHLSTFSLLQDGEWFCMQKILARNNSYIQTNSLRTSGIEEYKIILRLPTFHPGHEEPLDFLTRDEIT